MYIDNKIREEIRQNESRITRINNMLITPSQNNMTREKEEMLKAELKFLYASQTKIYNDLGEKYNKNDNTAIDYQKLAEDLNKTTSDKLIIRVGTYDGEYYVGDGKFESIQGELFIKTNSDTLFRVVSHDSRIVDNFDVIGSDATITPISELHEDEKITFDEVDVTNKTSLRRYFPNDRIGVEMFEAVQSLPVRFREDALEVFCDAEDREMWSLGTVEQTWGYFLSEIVEEMTEEEKEIYGF